MIYRDSKELFIKNVSWSIDLQCIYYLMQQFAKLIMWGSLPEQLPPSVRKDFFYQNSFDDKFGGVLYSMRLHSGGSANTDD